METKDFYWWKRKTDDIYQSVFAYIKMLDQQQSYRQNDNLRYMRLYGNTEFMGVNAYNYMRTEASYAVQNRVTLNVVQSMVDTVVSKLSKNKPRPYFLTDDGDFTLQRRAEKLSKFCEGQFYATDFYIKANQARTDACIFGTGCLKIYRKEDKIEVERVFIDEIMLDDTESYYGTPRQMHQRKWIHRDVLTQMFPKYKGAIEMATIDNNQLDNDKVRNGDMLLVVESWRLPSGPDAKDGKHAISIINQTLFSEPYEKDYFPFVFFRWQLKPIGFWGMGLAEQLIGLQLEINKILRTIQISMHLVSVPKIFIEASSKIVSAHLNNKIGGIVKFAGQAPIEGKLGSIPVELFQHLERLYAKAYEIAGVSQLAAQSQKPAGLDSGKALRTFNELESERFLSVMQRDEQVFLDAAKIMIDLAKDIAKDTKNYEIKVPGSGFLKTIKWDDVELDDDQYIMQVFPASALSQSPAARMNEVQELLQAGFISKEDGMKLLDFPDLKAYYNMSNAGVEDIERQIEMMVDKGEYQTPEPYQNLEYGIVKMQQAYLMYRSQNAPEETLELFRQWIEDAKSMLDKAKADVVAKQQIAQQQAAAPLGEPAAPPQSDMLPLETATPPITG